MDGATGSPGTPGKGHASPPADREPGAPYQQRIAEVCPDVDPALALGLLIDVHGTLDGLSPTQFAAQARIAADTVRENPSFCVALAASYGLHPSRKDDGS